MTEPQDPFAAPSDQPSQPPASQPAPPPYGAPQYGTPAPYGQPAPYGAPGAGRRNGFGIAALVLGLIALLPCTWFFFAFAILAVVFGFLGRGRAKRGEATNRGMATSGVVLGLLGIAGGIAFWGIYLANVDAFNRWRDCNDRASSDTTASEQCSKDLIHDVFGVDTSSS